ncbi:hypothetical protein [Curtobacterium sp. MCSS17_007]|uniref:hypothetical protein n=1 Tax=Curtobacterium sp. MCSS17_007 TaxID=2175646 RepID=UPI0024DFBF88|nr:hypothetical protein [Curtobacterium sp. MCSS17_007]WIE75229.1 hypothetical protein DEJ22_013375 [Curtobacterium sp. MCSS17_007]
MTRTDRLRAVRVAVLPVVTGALAEAGTGGPGAVTEATAVAAVVVATGAVAVTTERTVTVTLRTTVVATTERTATVTLRTTVIATTERTATVTLRTTVIATTERTATVTLRTTVIATTERTTLTVTGRTTVIATTERPSVVAVVTTTEGSLVAITTEGPTVALALWTTVLPTAEGTPVVTTAERAVSVPTWTVRATRAVAPRRPAGGVPVALARGPTAPVTERTVTVAERTALALPGTTTVTRRTIAVTTTPISLATLEVTRAGGPPAAFTARAAISVSPRTTCAISVVALLFVVVRHRCSSSRARAERPGGRPLCRCGVLHDPPCSPSSPSRTRQRVERPAAKTDVATGHHENEGLPYEFSMEGRWPHHLR